MNTDNTNEHPVSRFSRTNNIEEAQETSFTDFKSIYEGNVELVGEDDDDDDDDRREGRTAAMVLDSRGIRVNDLDKPNRDIVDNYDGA